MQKVQDVRVGYKVSYGREGEHNWAQINEVCKKGNMVVRGEDIEVGGDENKELSFFPSFAVTIDTGYRVRRQFDVAHLRRLP